MDTAAGMPPAFVKKAGGIKTVAALEAALKAYPASKTKPADKAKIIAAAKRLKATHRLPKGWATGHAKPKKDAASSDAIDWSNCIISCPDEACERSFIDENRLYEHAEAVHTFSDIQEMLREAVRDKYYVKGDYRATPPIPSNWVYVVDAAEDWVVFEVENDGDSKLQKASYSILDNKVSLGDPVEVVRKTVYEPVNEES